MFKALAKALAYVVGAGVGATATLFCVGGVIESLEEASDRARESTPTTEAGKQAAAN